MKRIETHTKSARELVLSARHAGGTLPHESREEALWHIASARSLLNSAKKLAASPGAKKKVDKATIELVVISMLWKNTRPRMA